MQFALPPLALSFAPAPQAADWLVGDAALRLHKAAIVQTPAPAPYPPGGTLYTLANGLLERVFFAGADGAWCTVEYRNQRSGQTFLRALAPEGNLTLNGHRFDLGGCAGQPAGHAEFFTPEAYAPGLRAANTSLLLTGVTHGAPEPLFAWTPGRRHAPTDVAWPPAGVHLTAALALSASAPLALRGARVTVHYELYDGMPVLRKWVEVRSPGWTRA